MVVMSNKIYRIFVINTGSTSTKVALYENDECTISENLPADKELIRTALNPLDQLEDRRNSILNFISRHHIDMGTVDIISSRGGALPPCQGGAYEVNKFMIDVLKYAPLSTHASSLASMVGQELAEKYNIRHIIYDSVSTDEMSEIACISGIPDILNNAGSHVLNPRMVARYVAKKRLHKKYEDSRIIVAHMGGGISITAHIGGKIVDYCNDYMGPMSPERSGSLPAGTLVRLCYSGKYSRDEMIKKVSGQGGLTAYLGTADAIEVERRIAKGDKYAQLIYDAMCYQTGKKIGEIAPIFCGDIDTIIFTGSLAKSQYIIDYITNMVSFIAPIELVPGEMEMEGLASGALRVLRGEEDAKYYDLLPTGYESKEAFYDAFPEAQK